MKLYRHFDAAGRLLYVGIARDPVLRLVEHESVGGWSEDIATITIERFETEEAARRAEDIAIIEENPIHNIRRPSWKKRKRMGYVRPQSPLPIPEMEWSYDAHMGQYYCQIDCLRESIRFANLAELESASGVSRSTLFRLRQGRNIPRAKILDAIWAGLDKLDAAEAEAQ